MIIAIWDWLFTRRVWTTIKEFDVYPQSGGDRPTSHVYVLRDQFGNIKQKEISS
jgi:hypothetical protein